MNNLSSSAYNLYERVWLTNEIPPMNVYGMLNRQLQNKWSGDILGISKVNYNTDEYASTKTVRGTKSSNYKADYIEYINTDGDTVSGFIEKPDFEVNGLMGTEIDYLNHEMHRYLFRLYPEHDNALYTLTESERLAYFQEAGYMINSSFDLTNITADSEEEEFYKYHKFITNVTAARKYTGSLQQEIMLLNLLGENNIVKNCDYYVADNRTGVITNPYTGVESVDLRKYYEFLTSDSFASSYSDTLFANTEDNFKFALEATSSTVAKTSSLTDIKSFRQVDDTYKEIQAVVNNLYKYSGATDAQFLIPLSTDYTISDVIAAFPAEKIYSEYDTVQLVNSYGNKKAVVPMINGEFTMKGILGLQNKKISNLFTLEDVPSAIEFKLGDAQYNQTFLKWVSLYIYNRLVDSFTDSTFAIKYTGCLREEDASTPIPWKMDVVVYQDNLPILKGILSKDFIAKCYEATSQLDLGTGDTFNDNGITPDTVFAYLVNPKNMENFCFGGKDFEIKLTISRFFENPVLDSKVLDPHYNIPYVYETDDYPAFSEEWMSKGSVTKDDFSDDFWSVRDSLVNEKHSVVEIGDFSLVFNTVELPYKSMSKIYSNFQTFASVVLVSEEDKALNRVIFYNSVSLKSYSDEDIVESALNQDNICDYLYEEVELANTRLLKTEGYVIDETHIKIERDITDLIEKYGRIDFLILNCKGDKFFGKLDQAYVQGIYCIARVNQISSDFNVEDWKETKIYVYIWHKTNDLFEDRQSSVIQAEDLQSSLVVRPAEYESIPYFIANVKNLSSENYKYLYNNVFSDDPSVFFSTEMRQHNLNEPITLSKYESILGIPGGDLNLLKVAETLINEHKSLYLDSAIYSNMIVPYVGKSVCYSGKSQALSTNYNTSHLPAYAYFTNIDLEDYPDFESFYNSATNADEKDMGYIETTYNNHLVIWGDIVWDTNEKDTVKRLRTIWSGFLSSFVVEDLKDRFPTYSQIKSEDGVNPVTIRINNFNYSYNDGLPTTAYNLTVPGFKDPMVTINCNIIALNADSTKQTEGDAKLFAFTNDEDYDDISASFKFVTQSDKDGKVFGETVVALSHCSLDLGKYYGVDTNPELTVDISTSLVTTVNSKELKAISAWIEDSSFSHQSNYFNAGSNVLEMVAQQLVAGYVYETQGKTSAKDLSFSVEDVLNHFTPDNWDNKVPCLFYINSSDKLTAVIVYIEKSTEAPSGSGLSANGNYFTVKVQEYELPSIPEIVENILGSESTTYTYLDSSVVKSLQTLLSEKGNYIPIGAEGYFTEVLIDANGNPIFSDSEKYLNECTETDPLYQDKKVIKNELTTYQGESTSFILKDKRSGEENEYSFVHNEKYFKDYENILATISIDTDTKEDAVYKDVLFQLPSGIAFEDDDNIILHNVRTPVTRTLYSLDKEIKLLDRRYNLPESNIVAYDDSSIYLKSNNLVITDVESIANDIAPTNTKLAGQPIPGGTEITLGHHWKPTDTGIGYKYYKRKFVAPGTIYADNPNRIEFDDLSVTLSEHISAGDSVQVLILTPLSQSVGSDYYILKNANGTASENFKMTWKLLHGEASIENDIVTYKIYLLAQIDESNGSGGLTHTSRIYKVTMTTQDSTSSAALIKSIENSTDVIYKDGRYYSVLVDGYSVKENEISLDGDTTGNPLLLDNNILDSAFTVASGVTTTGDFKYNQVSLEEKDNLPVVSPVVVHVDLGNNTYLLGDCYGRWIKQYTDEKGTTYTLLNDPGHKAKQQQGDMNITEDNFITIINSILPMVGSDYDSENATGGVVAKLTKEEDGSEGTYYSDPANWSRQALALYDLLDAENAVGKTIKEAFEGALFTLPGKTIIELPTYISKSRPFDVSKDVYLLESGSGKISPSNYQSIVPYFASMDVDISRVTQNSACTINKEEGKVYIFDKSTCVLHIIDYKEGGVEEVPLWRFLGIAHDPTWDTNGKFPLLNSTALLTSRKDDRETAWENYRSFMKQLYQTDSANYERLRVAFNEARDEDYEGYADFTLSRFDAWATKMENLLYLNPGVAWIEYSNCPWKPSVIQELASDDSNIFNIRWANLLKSIISEPSGLTEFKDEDIKNNESAFVKADEENNVEGVIPSYQIANGVAYKDALEYINAIDKDGYFIDTEGNQFHYWKPYCVSLAKDGIDAFNKAMEEELNALKAAPKDEEGITTGTVNGQAYYKIKDDVLYRNLNGSKITCSSLDENGYYLDSSKKKVPYYELSTFVGYAEAGVDAYNKAAPASYNKEKKADFISYDERCETMSGIGGYSHKTYTRLQKAELCDKAFNYYVTMERVVDPTEIDAEGNQIYHFYLKPSKGFEDLLKGHLDSEGYVTNNDGDRIDFEEYYGAAGEKAVILLSGDDGLWWGEFAEYSDNEYALVESYIEKAINNYNSELAAKYAEVAYDEGDAYYDTTDLTYKLRDVAYSSYVKHLDSNNQFLGSDDAVAKNRYQEVIDLNNNVITAYNEAIDKLIETNQLEDTSASDVSLITSGDNKYYQLNSDVDYADYVEHIDDGLCFVDDSDADHPYRLTEDYDTVKALAEQGVGIYNDMPYYKSLSSATDANTVESINKAVTNFFENYLIQLRLKSDDGTGTLMPAQETAIEGSLTFGSTSSVGRVCPLSGEMVLESRVSSVSIQLDDDGSIFVYGALSNPDNSTDAIYTNLTKDGSGYYPFALTIDPSNDNEVSLVSATGKVSSMLSDGGETVTNYIASTYTKNMPIPGTSYNSLITGEPTGDDATGINIPIGLIWASGLFESVSLTESGIQFKNPYTSVDMQDYVTGKISKVGGSYCTFSGADLGFDNVDSTSVVLMVEDYGKDNFLLGYGSSSVISLLPETMTVFEVTEYKYADFVANINTYNVATSGGYYPIFENGDYPYPTDIQNDMLPNFYKCEYDSVQQKYIPTILKNILGRRILPIYPVLVTLETGKYIPTDISGIVLNTDYSTPGSVFKLEDGKYKYLTSVSGSSKTYTEIPTIPDGDDTNTKVYSGIVQASTVGKSYAEVANGAGFVYALVDDPRTALSTKCYKSSKLTAGENSVISAENDYIKISGLDTSSLASEAEIKTYKNANASCNTSSGTTLNTMLTVIELAFKTSYATATLPKEVPITQFTRSTSVIRTELEEIKFPMGGYGCTIAQVGDGCFDPEKESAYSTEASVKAIIENGDDDPRSLYKGCRFADGIFFNKGSLKNKNGDVFKIYTGEDASGNSTYNTTFFASHKLGYSSFRQADMDLDTKLAPAWEIDAEYVLPDLAFTANVNNTVEDNIIRFTYKDLTTLWGDFDYNNTTKYPEAIYDMAVNAKTWSMQFFRTSKELDEDAGLYAELSELISTNTESDLQTIADVKDFIGHTRRFSGSITTTIPMSLKHLNALTKKLVSTIQLTGENQLLSVQGLDPDDTSVYACNSEGTLYKILNNAAGSVVEGGDSGDLINASQISDVETDIRLVTMGMNSLRLAGCSGLKIGVSRVSVKKVSGGIKFVSEGNLSYLYSYDNEGLKKGSISMRWVDTSNESDGEGTAVSSDLKHHNTNVDCGLEFSDSIEFTYQATTGDEYNYIILFDKDMNTVGQIYMGIPISPNTLISYVRA